VKRIMYRFNVEDAVQDLLCHPDIEVRVPVIRRLFLSTHPLLAKYKYKYKFIIEGRQTRILHIGYLKIVKFNSDLKEKF
jgi:hypothetical protein